MGAGATVVARTFGFRRFVPGFCPGRAPSRAQARPPALTGSVLLPGYPPRSDYCQRVRAASLCRNAEKLLPISHRLCVRRGSRWHGGRITVVFMVASRCRKPPPHGGFPLADPTVTRRDDDVARPAALRHRCAAVPRRPQTGHVKYQLKGKLAGTLICRPPRRADVGRPTLGHRRRPNRRLGARGSGRLWRRASASAGGADHSPTLSIP